MMRISMISAALVVALVGYGSTVALLLLAAPAVGATPGKTASRVLAVSLAKAAGSVGPSLATRVPVVLAWSIPDAAMIEATSGVTMAGAVAVAVAAAMLAGVLLPFCLKAAEAAQALPMVPRAFKLPVSRQTVFRVPQPSDRSKDACRQEGGRGLCPSDGDEADGCRRRC
jgi:predicted benzoate:H+ symporter BenE